MSGVVDINDNSAACHLTQLCKDVFKAQDRLYLLVFYLLLVALFQKTQVLKGLLRTHHTEGLPVNIAL